MAFSFYLTKALFSVQNPAATASVMDADGFFNTGDLGWLTPHVPSGPARNCGGLLVLDGRAKDTIVMANGYSSLYFD